MHKMRRHYFTQRKWRSEPSHPQELKGIFAMTLGTQRSSVVQQYGGQVRVLTLNYGEHLDSTLFRLKKGWTLQFRLGPSLLGKDVKIFCNHPETPEGEIFDRRRYRGLAWRRDGGPADDTSFYTEINIVRAGSFHFYFTCDENNSYDFAMNDGYYTEGYYSEGYTGKNKRPDGSGFFLVEPDLFYGRGDVLPLDCVQCQTVLAKCLGPFHTWEKKLAVSRESGYNMIHFTPIQALGISNSSYSLKDQLRLNPIFSEHGDHISIEHIEKLTHKMATEWKVLSICDVVLNHTANESAWIKDHPECTYNMDNSPHLRPAFLLDAILARFAFEISQGKWQHSGVPKLICIEDHLQAMRGTLLGQLLPQAKLWEMYTVDIESTLSHFARMARERGPLKQGHGELTIQQDPQFRRNHSKVDMEQALSLFNIQRKDCYDEAHRVQRCTDDLREYLETLNRQVTDTLQSHLVAAVDNCLAGIRYFRVQTDGPRLKEITPKDPLIPRYFTYTGNTDTLLDDVERIMYANGGRYIMAHNGWVMNADPLRNFADADSNVYLRRELIAWGDSVKLRYGEKPEDCPFLWQHMREYVEQTARTFHGIRLDNCHSTPIPVAEYLLDAARRIRPDLYVVAELFTNSDEKDNIFINRLGITSLIREAMSAWDSHEEGRLVYRYGGDPVGAFIQPPTRPLVPSIAHALFLDVTHDNPSPVQTRSVYDLLPSSALVNMACCGSGSNRGYDELVPHDIHVVDEIRHYTEWAENVNSNGSQTVGLQSGIIAAKRALNKLHFELGISGFNQVFVDQVDSDVVAVTRHCPATHQSVVLVACTAFKQPEPFYKRTHTRPLRVEGTVDEVIFEASLCHRDSKSGGAWFVPPPSNFRKDGRFINGLSDYKLKLREHFPLSQAEAVHKGESGDPQVTQIDFTEDFQPGCVIAFKVSLHYNMTPAIAHLGRLVERFNMRSANDMSTVDHDFDRIVSRLNLADLNRALFHCEEEERDEGHGFGAYNIPGFGSTVYCGLQGFISLLSEVRQKNDLGHPLCGNLRAGNWMIDYISQRLKLDPGTEELGRWFEDNLRHLKELPRYLVPSYFDAVLQGVYQALLQRVWNCMSTFIQLGSHFVKSLGLGSVQCGGIVKSAQLPKLSPALPPPLPPTRLGLNGQSDQVFLTLSAGLPHFSTGYMRNWGRDTFISLRGLFILTGRYQEARYHILAYAACLRHGLIPNLLDGGKNARFNCRDAVWWWLYSIQSYVQEVPDGWRIFQDPVSRLFPRDDSPALEPGSHDQPLQDIVQEALRVHFQGLKFRERNAGAKIDAHMNDQGFNNEIGVDCETGFVYGGNGQNCGTWMDKMGSSDKAGTKGRPATPRDGSAVELVGLCKAALKFLNGLYTMGRYPHNSVERRNNDGSYTTWTFQEWEDKIVHHFERKFWINWTPIPENEPRPELINRRGIYKDSHNASQAWADYQLRPNFTVAMVAAPDMFDPHHAWSALGEVEKILLGPLGMKTLDPSDWAYCGDYNNCDDGNDSKTAQGFNYHQGPEWVWPVGFFLRARLHFARIVGGEAELRRTMSATKAYLSRHFTELTTSPWRGLPELTNKDGRYCSDSCRIQAWSMATILETLHQMSQLEEELGYNHN
ncbi:glycogen debranching enzyme isoform X2 [Cloeon dipterum]|uniref:glycogen debranching enzyme isoform X2 n=1 Tax=Cloeon dipterum TaxID=197152 RepID=UPI0032201139